MYVEAVYLIGIKCMMDLLVTKVAKSTGLFNSKLMITSISHKCEYYFMVSNEINKMTMNC